jgi:hypothetical protein
MHPTGNSRAVSGEEKTVMNRVWWISGAVIVAGVVFGLGVILGVMIGDDDDGDGPGVAATERADGDGRVDDGDRDADPEEGPGRLRGREGGLAGPLLEELLDGLAERLDGRFGDRERLGPDRPFRLFPDGFELPEDFELPDRFELPGGARGLGECLADGFGDLFGEGDGPLGDRARRLWESCIA